MGPHLSQPFRFPLWPFWETLHPPPYNVKRQRHHAVRGHCESARCRHPGHLTNPSGLAAHGKPKRQLAWYPQKERYNSLRFWQKTPWSSFDEFPKVQKRKDLIYQTTRLLMSPTFQWTRGEVIHGSGSPVLIQFSFLGDPENMKMVIEFGVKTILLIAFSSKNTTGS